MNKIVTILVAAMFFLVSATYSQTSLTISPTTVMGNTGEIVTISLVVDDFDDIVSMQYGIAWDPTVIQFESVDNFNLVDLTANSFNVDNSANGIFTVAWFDNSTAGVSVADGETLFTMSFTVLGDASSGSTVVFDGSTTSIEIANATNGVITNSVIFTEAQFGDPNGNNNNNNSGNTSPLISTISGASGDNGTTVCLDISVANFTDITAMDYSLNWDASVLQFNEIRNINLAGLAQSSFGTSNAANGQLSVNWANSAGATVPNGNIYQACFNLIGAAGTNSTVFFATTPTPINVTTTASTTSVGITQTNGTVSVNNVTTPPTNPPPSTGNLINIGAVDAPAGSTICVPVTVNDFDDIVSLQFSLQWDPAIIQYDNVANFNLPDLNAQGFNTEPELITVGQTTMAWFDNSTEGVTLADGTTIFEICFTVLGSSGSGSSIVFTDTPTGREMASTDGVIPFSGTNGAVTIDGGTLTPPPTTTPPSGDALINAAAIEAGVGTTICVPFTANDFTNVASLQFSLEWDPAILEFSALANTDILGITEPGNLNLSDVDNGRIAFAWSDLNAVGITVADGMSVFDICFVVKGAVGTSTAISFTDTPTPQLFSDANNEMAFVGGNGTLTVVDGSVMPPTPPPSGDALVNVGAIEAEVGTTICVPFTANDFTDVASLQFSLEWDPAVLEFSELANTDILGISEPGNLNLSDVDNGRIAFAWSDINAVGVTVADGMSIFDICFIVKGAIGESTPISFTDNPTPQLFSDANNEMAFVGGSGTLTVVDGSITPPPSGDALVNVGAIEAEVGTTICVPFTVNDFTNVASLQFSLEWDPAVLEFSELANTDILGISEPGNLNLSDVDNGRIAFAWSDINAVGVTVADGMSIFDICFIVKGAVGASTPISFTDTPTPQLFSDATNEMAFVGGSGTLTVVDGSITPPTGDALVNVGAIEAEVGTTICVPFTVNDFTDVASLQFSLEWDPAVLEFSELANTDILGISEPGNLNLSDVDNGRIAFAWSDINAVGVTVADGMSIFDICFIVKGAVGASTPISFTDTPTPQLFSDATNEMAFVGGSGTLTVVDGSIMPPTGDALVNVGAIEAEVGTTICVPFTVNDFTNIASLQFSLEWDPAVLEYSGLANTDILGISEPGNLNLSDVDNGRIAFAWSDINAVGVTVADGMSIFDICFIVKGAVGASTPISFTDTPTPQLFSDADTEMAFVGGSGTLTVVDGGDCPGAITAVANPTNVSCNGLSDGSIAINASGGDGIYTYQWSDPSIGNIPNPIGLPAGVYSVTISSCGGQEIRNDIPTASLTILEPTAIQSVITPEDASCFGVSDGRINVSVSGGSAPYTYTWSDPSLAPLNRPINAAAGTYNLTITDASGCTNSMTGITVSGPSQMTASVATTPASCTGFGDGTASITVAGGTAPFSYTWSMAGVSGPNPNNLPGGNYTVTIRDAGQCSIEVPITIANTVTFSAVVQVVEDACGDNSGAIQISPSGGTLPFTYSWTGPVVIGDTNTAENLPTGNYRVRVTDANGCFFEENILVGGPTATLAASGTVTDVDCLGEDNGMINLAVAGGFEPYSFIWSNGATTQNVNNLTVGGYTVTITDNKVCTYTQNFEVGTRSNMMVSVEVTSGAPSGEATATVTGGVEPYRYEWCNGQVGQSATDLDEGNCSLTVIDALGCTIVQNVEIRVDNPIATIAMSSAISCNGLADGSLQADVVGGVSGYTYAWSNGETTSTITNVGAGNYSLTVTDAAGNEGIASFDFDGPTPIIIDLSDPIVPSCDNDGVISISVSGGAMPYEEILWSNDVVGLRNEGLRAGEYGVIVTDDNDCTAEENFRITTDETCVPCYMSNKVVTPNDDGRNDAFCISCVDLAANNHLEVYNRWGQLVFEADNYQCVLGTEADCWKGLTRSNNLVDEGGYFWVLEFDDGNERRRIRDHVTILRDN